MVAVGLSQSFLAPAGNGFVSRGNLDGSQDRGRGAFIDIPLADEQRLLGLNVGSTVHPAKRLLPPMVRRGSGRIPFTSSVAATMPGP